MGQKKEGGAGAVRGVPAACYAPGGLAAARGLAAASALEGSAAKPAQPEFSEILRKAGKRALGGGIAGAMAMGINVTTLMWIRTTINYQYRYGLSTGEAMRTLYKEGGGRARRAALLPGLRARDDAGPPVALR